MSEFKAGDFVHYKDTIVKIGDEGYGLYGQDPSGRVCKMAPDMRLATPQEIEEWYSARYDHCKEETDRFQTAVYRARKHAMNAFHEWMNHDKQK